MILDLVAPIMQGIAYIMLLLVLIVYYMKAYSQPQLRSFWLLFAVALSMNLIANIGWIMNFTVTQSPLSTVTWLDIFYIIPYLLIGFALWSYPTSLSRRVWLWVGVAVVLALALVVVLYFGQVVPQHRGTFLNFIIYAAYPILDAGLIVLAWARYRAARGTSWAKIALLLACAVTSYGLANTIELTGYVLTPLLNGFLQNFFWILRHVFVLIAALSVRNPSDLLDE